jgi:hypothetical protein
VGLQLLTPHDWLEVEDEGFVPGSSFLGAPQDEWLHLVALVGALPLVHALDGCAHLRREWLLGGHVVL